MRFFEINEGLRNEIFADYKDGGVDRLTTYKEMAVVDFFLEPVKIGDSKWIYGVVNKEEANLNNDLWFVKSPDSYYDDGVFGFEAIGDR
jgi:hypothetical protein